MVDGRGYRTKSKSKGCFVKPLTILQSNVGV